MNWSYFVNAIPRFVDATLITLQLSYWGILFSLLLGVVIALIITSKMPFFSLLAKSYIEFSRNTPLLIQLFFLYYGLPKIGIKWDGFSCGVIALAFLGGSYMAEALRAGLLAVPKGQIEAGKAIGLKKWQIFSYIVFPQAWVIAMPAIVANILFLIKETSVISAVAVAELMFVTKDIIGMDYKTNEALLLLLLCYLVILLPISLFARYLEMRMRNAKYGS